MMLVQRVNKDCSNEYLSGQTGSWNERSECGRPQVEVIGWEEGEQSPSQVNGAGVIGWTRSSQPNIQYCSNYRCLHRIMVSRNKI